MIFSNTGALQTCADYDAAFEAAIDAMRGIIELMQTILLMQQILYI